MNKTNLLSIFKEAKKLITQGVSIVPVRMVQEGAMPEKSPIPKWTKYQNEIITEQEFFNIINNARVDVGIAIIGGAVSGNLECLDVDDKHYPGIAHKFLLELKETYPELYAKLRIEKSKNNGVHLPYKLSDAEASNNQNLSFRHATDEELAKRPDLKKYCFIELKGEKGKFVIPPTDGYSFIQENDVPTITFYERQLMVNLAKLYNEVVQPPKILKVNTTASRNYSVNPWEDYNSSDDAEKILDKHGWQRYRENNEYIYFRKPGKKEGNSASFVKSERFYRIFTTSSQLEDKCYSPASILCDIEFNGDTKECFKWLVENGYGYYTKTFETKLIHQAVVSKKTLPSNISEEAKELYKEQKNNYELKYPHGVFWDEKTTEKGEHEYKINRQLILSVANGLGFRLINSDLIRVDDFQIHKITQRDFICELKNYIKEEDETVFNAINDKFEDYIQKSCKYLISRLDVINENELLADTRCVAYKCFFNGVLKITPSDRELIPYEKIDKYYYHDEILNHEIDLDKRPGGLFLDFLSKAIVKNDNLDSYIGYLMHRYKSTETPYFVLLTESVENPKDGGGAGKNIFTNLLGHFTTHKDVSGSQVKFTSEFFQSWQGERLFSISDLPRNFDFLFLKNISSNSALIKKLYRDEESVSAEKLPKLLLSTNYSIDISDGGLKRRTMIIEFTNFFTLAGGVDAHYNNTLFPQDWNDDDWGGYYAYMIDCVQKYLKSPKLVSTDLSYTGWLKQFALNFGQTTYQFIDEHIEQWQFKGSIPVSEFNEQYHQFLNDNGINDRFRKSPQNMSDALIEYCKHKNIPFENNKVGRVNSVTTRCKVFGKSKDNNEFVALSDGDLPF